MRFRRKILFSSLTAFSAVLSGCQSGQSPGLLGGGSSGYGQASSGMFPGQQAPVLAQQGPFHTQPSYAGGPAMVGSPAGGMFSSPAAAAQGIGGAFQRATGAVGNALTLQPRVISASDPVSLATRSPQLGPEVYLEAAKMYEGRGNLGGAVVQYQRALELAPNNITAVLSYARLYDRMGNFRDAQAIYQRALQLDPQNATAHNDLGLCLAREGRHDESMAELHKAILLQPDKKLYRNNLATVLLEAGRTDDALVQLTAVHGSALAHYNLGYMLQQRGQTAPAIEHFRRAAEIDPRLAQAREMLQKLGGAATEFANFSGQPRAGMMLGESPDGAAIGPDPTARPTARPMTTTDDGRFAPNVESLPSILRNPSANGADQPATPPAANGSPHNPEGRHMRSFMPPEMPPAQSPFPQPSTPGGGYPSTGQLAPPLDGPRGDSQRNDYSPAPNETPSLLPPIEPNR